MSAVFLVHPGKFVEARDLAGNLHVQFARIKACNAANAAPPFEDRFSECRAPNTIRADYANACDDDASLSGHLRSEMSVAVARLPENRK